MRTIITAAICVVLMGAHGAFAGGADVVEVVVRDRADGTFLFDVTVAHADEGWEHYANAFEITDGNGAVFGTRVLAHPHVNEQPFTRSLSGVEIPAKLTEVTVRAIDSVHGATGKTMKVALPGR